MSPISLYDLNEYIRQVLALNFSEALWLRCEISQLNKRRGQFYLNLIQKEEEGENIIAQSEAVLWNRTYIRLKKKLGIHLNSILQEGMEVQLQVQVDFHEQYGLKLVVEDIDLTYTLGKLELKRRNSIEELQKLNLTEKNKEQKLPLVLKRIAVLSSEKAAGLQDYLEHLNNNVYGYQFENQLFETSVQGINVEKEMTTQLQKIEKQKQYFECVIIIRGGGARMDLSAFDNLKLCKAVANFPLPVLVGIGHEVDETVLDLIAYASLKTPTAVADFIIQRNTQFESYILELGLKMKEFSLQTLKENQLKLNQFQQFIKIHSSEKVKREKLMLQYLDQEIPNLVKNKLQKEEVQLNNLEKMCQLLHPENVLKRGFSITLKNGKAIKDSTEVEKGAEIETILENGKLTSIIK